jgi:hypothetical protein
MVAIYEYAPLMSHRSIVMAHHRRPIDRVCSPRVMLPHPARRRGAFSTITRMITGEDATGKPGYLRGGGHAEGSRSTRADSGRSKVRTGKDFGEGSG